MSLPVPGTVHLVDLDGTLRVRHGKGKQDIVLIPQPSSDPEDPLNWSERRKNNNRFWQIMWTLVGCAIISSLSPAYLLIEADTGITVADLNTGIGLMYLFLGWGNLVLQPLAMNFGRRPILLVSLLGTSLMILWSAYINSSGLWYFNRILMGFFFAPVESLIEIVITDITFTHDRGFHMGIYAWNLFSGAFLAPIPAGYIAQNLGWRWIQWIGAILGLSTTLLMYFFFEETMFFRQTIQAEFLDEATEATEKPQPSHVPSEDADERGLDLTNATATGNEKSSTTEATNEPLPLTAKQKAFRTTRLWGFRSPEQPNTFAKFFFLPIILMRYPAMLFGGILVGSILSWFNVVNATIASVLGNPPYNFTANAIGLTYLAAVIGATVGCFLSGWFSDIVSERLARRNHGIKEPEHRLWVALIPLALHPLGFLLYGIGATEQIHWVGLAFGIGLIALCLPMGSNIGLTYVIDSYKEVAGEAVVTVILIRNTMGS